MDSKLSVPTQSMYEMDGKVPLKEVLIEHGLEI